MITHVKGPRDKMDTIRLNADFLQGQWGFRSGQNADSEDVFDVVNSYTDAQLAVYKLGIVAKENISAKGSDTDFETIYVNDGDANDDGRLAQFIFGDGHTIEDDRLDARVDADFSSASYGTAMVLTASGFPTLDGASDDPGASATVVALFENYLGNVVTYTTV